MTNERVEESLEHGGMTGSVLCGRPKARRKAEFLPSLHGRLRPGPAPAASAIVFTELTHGLPSPRAVPVSLLYQCPYCTSPSTERVAVT